MKKKLSIITILSFSAFLFIYIFLSSTCDASILKELQGEIYYTKRVNEILTLYKSNADLGKEELVYSHKGKGKDNYGSYNDNILDYYYDPETGDIHFIAMNEGDWSLFCLKAGEKNATIIKKVDEKDFYLEKTNYIDNHSEKKTAIRKKGSLYLIEEGKETCIKKFYGIYDDKFTGYSPIGFSPDMKYLIYFSSGHLTPIGSIIEGMLTGSSGSMYIMDLQTKKSAKYPNISSIQWLMDPNQME